MELVHVSVRTPVGVFLTNPDGRVWSVFPGPSGFSVFTVPYRSGEWWLSAAEDKRVTGPGRRDGEGLWIHLPSSGTASGWVVASPPPTPPDLHDPLADISVPPAEEGHVWVLLVLERRDGHRSVPVRVQVAVADLVEFLTEGVT